MNQRPILSRPALLVAVLCVLLSAQSAAGRPPRFVSDGHEEKPVRVPRERRVPVSPVPIFWSWQPPLGEAAEHPDITEFVRHFTHMAPETVADAMCDRILARELGAGRVAILLQGFGMGDGDPKAATVVFPALFRHWSDGVKHRTVADSGGLRGMPGPGVVVKDWWRTTWHRHGIAECQLWMTRFIARYKVRQAMDHRIPDPHRFHFDSEGISSFHGTAPATFDAMRRDSRWETEAIPGHDGKTLAELYEEAGEPSYDPNKRFYVKANRKWTNWYAGVGRQAADGAMDEAAYQLIRAAWPKCLSSNFATSDRYDGEGDPPRLNFTRRDDWLRFRQNASGDLQAPVCYWVEPASVPPGTTLEEETLRRVAVRIDANINSFGGPHHNITPWVQALGNISQHKDRTVVVTESFMRDMLALLKEKGVQEFILWSTPSTQDEELWNRFVQIINDLWPAKPLLHAGDLRGD